MEKSKLAYVFGMISNVKNFIYPLMDFFFPNLIKKNYVIETRTGLKLWIRPKRNKIVGDIDILIEILIENQYKLGKLIKPNYTVIDIGGQAGFFSTMASKIVGNNGKVYVFEPSKSNFNELIKNVKLNNLKNIVAHNLAVSKSEGKLKFFISEENVGAHSLLNDANKRFTEVKSTSLKKIFCENNLKKVNFLKMDCEGSEYEILLESPISTLKKIDTIILEQHITHYTKKYDKDSIICRLKSAGFHIQILKQIYYEKEGNFLIILARQKNKKDSIIEED